LALSKAFIMNWLDIVLAIMLVGGIISGFKNGIIGEIASIAALILGVWGSIKFSWWTADLLGTWGIHSEHMNIISFVITFILIVVLVHVLASMLNKLLDSLALGFVNKLLGMVIGIIKTALIVSVLIFALDALDEEGKFINNQVKEKSLFYEPLGSIVPGILPFLPLEEMKKVDSSQDSETVRS